MTATQWRVKGVLFVDYVRMLRSLKGVDWSAHLAPADLAYLRGRIEPDAWYPMATFEQLGNLVLRYIARSDLRLVRAWGRTSVDLLRAAQPMLLAPDDPIESLRRFKVLRSTYFDFDALELPMLHEGEAQVVVRYHMGMPAEEAATVQTLGFFERLLEVAGARGVEGELRDKSWAGAPRTLLTLHWTP